MALSSLSSEISGDDVISELDGSDTRLIQLIRNWFIEYPDPKSSYFFSIEKPILEGQFNPARVE
jgi:hypothetical protein